MTRRRTRTSRTRRVVTKVIKVGILGQPAQDVILEDKTTAEKIAQQLDLGDFRTVKATKNKNLTGGYKEIKPKDVINGFCALLFVPSVSGGN